MAQLCAFFNQHCLTPLPCHWRPCWPPFDYLRPLAGHTSQLPVIDLEPQLVNCNAPLRDHVLSVSANGVFANLDQNYFWHPILYSVKWYTIILIGHDLSAPPPLRSQFVAAHRMWKTRFSPVTCAWHSFRLTWTSNLMTRPFVAGIARTRRPAAPTSSRGPMPTN